ncbi:MAG: saccharopine dehydrogenase NADP-binding domain-containing protein [Actinomycetota bacterium]|nr:saccharopine dehydrogenase NADP-binding domain-containing protein [Actinomycetota bacterium]
MPDVLLFGATGYTGTLTAHALARRGTRFAIAGRNRTKLNALAADTDPDDVRVVEVGDVHGLARACDDVAALITCVGPFHQLGSTAVEAALRARVHYVDSTGEIDFVGDLITRRMDPARAAGIVMVPAAGFDEVPADVAVSLAVEGITRPRAVVTYQPPSKPSVGTIRSILSGPARSSPSWIADGKPVVIRTGERSRWAPMPPPLGPKYSLSFPFAIGRIAPLHLELESFETYAHMERAVAPLVKIGVPLGRAVLGLSPVQKAIEFVLGNRTSGPDENARRRDTWTLLVEARSEEKWRNVALQGNDPYGLTAETLAAVALKLACDGHEEAGVMSPVQAAGLETLQKELIDFGVDFQTWEGD